MRALLLLLLVACNGQPAARPARAEPQPPPAAPAAQVPASTPALPPLPPGARLQDEQNSIDVFKAAAPATVFVTQSQLVLDRYRMRATEEPAGTGSGFLWDDQGHVVTNYHVVDKARSLTVTLFDQTTWPATFVGGDPRKDVAVLKIDPPKDKLIPIRKAPAPYELEVGQKTLAIGNPFGLDHTLTVGAVSALGREVQGYGGLTIRGVIQTDASINPGNSGGPLLDSQGQIIGMNTMIYSPSGSSAGIGFAVPYAIIERTVSQIVTKGKVTQVGLGVGFVDDRVARRAGVKGVILYDVQRGSPADLAGLHGLKMGPRGSVDIGDVIIAIDGNPVATYDDLYQVLDPHAAGETVRVTISREGHTADVDLKLIEIED